MAIKYCVAKLFGNIPMYLTDATTPADIWISDVDSHNVVWWANKDDARKALRGPETFVAHKEYVDIREKVGMLHEVCMRISNAVDTGAALSSMTEIEVPYDVFSAAGVSDYSSYDGKAYIQHSGKLHGVKILSFVEVCKG